MGDRSLVRTLKAEIANQIRHTPIFRDHICRTAENTFSCPICEIHGYVTTYPLAVLSVLRHFHFFDEAYLPQESDLFDLLGPDKINRMVEEEQRRMFGSVHVICQSCSHKISFFSTYQQNLNRHEGTNFSFKCTKCGTENDVYLFRKEDLAKNKLRKMKRPRRTSVRIRRTGQQELADAAEFSLRRQDDGLVRTAEDIDVLEEPTLPTRPELANIYEGPPINWGNTTTQTMDFTQGGGTIT